MCEPQEKLGILAEHYSETYTYLQLVVKKRDRLFVIVLVIAAVLMIFMTNPEPWQELLNRFLNSQAGSEDPISMLDVPLIGTLLWFGLLAVGHTYFQTVLHIQRQYDYIRKLEKEIQPQVGEVAFTREGKHYKQYSNVFSNWTKFVFWILFPVIMLVFIVFWAITLFGMHLAVFYTVLNTTMPVLFLVSMGLYLYQLFEKEKKNSEQPAESPATANEAEQGD